ncbi:MAG: modification methylase [bacterium (Candidatus Ratteibacteria) CG_4_10_14_3_um_filter_41_18]|uniref:Methyltransferase n=4 Tax=Candidatus Ratteibacteria TaxID=2979319 RepID=A0A2M7YF60_9BACT|nr:MAG: modification methylase [bacterium (Candidatus Ratteibacteria) CG01_land_8_20_14_3_00_40_19]PIW32218.1 MAG: modification methylase [bacterium (Candidatus Ratteibacteria) CG15_BIG_FIL_POST_REV_8_21_14_020_41_12]PIX76535.1 MAG: modification methylase [bacterium (Candidatus Ratteibacteria) CG_4_10_14_3_um_filter_41_18]PJA61598.1 MAG: modification methylase [bacterium (Candidatus Ratteibacteria) CG_4_9_14_3_um_filter_41_21]HCG77099.1 modification methylase [bacterium]
MNNYKIIHGDCLKYLSREKIPQGVDLTFLDPPFNQDKEYNSWNDNLPEDKYWQMMKDVCKDVFGITSNGGAIYFMQREKNTEFVLECLRETGWSLQNLIIWKKKTSAVPCTNKLGKHYQVIGFATKGNRPRVFNRLRIFPPLPPNYKYERENGVYLTDVWDDIRELTSGYFAGDEAIRKENGERFHKQQSPIALLLRIILSSTKIGDTVLDPFAGTGTALVVAEQLGRKSIGIEIDLDNVRGIKHRLAEMSGADNALRFYKEYIYTENLKEIWYVDSVFSVPKKKEELKLFKL